MESNYSGRLSRVLSQPVGLPSSRPMLSPDKRLPLDTWNTSGLQENVFGNQFSTFDSLRDLHQGIRPCAPQKGMRISPTSYRVRGTHVIRDDKESKDTIPMPTFARRPSAMSSLIQVEFPQNSMAGPERQQMSNSQLHNHSWCGKYV